VQKTQGYYLRGGPAVQTDTVNSYGQTKPVWVEFWRTYRNLARWICHRSQSDWGTWLM